MELTEKLRMKLIAGLDLSRDISDAELNEIITGMVLEEYQGRHISLREKLKISRELFYSIRGLDVMQEILEDEDVTEIMINGYDHIFIEKHGKLFRYPGSFSSPASGFPPRIISRFSPVMASLSFLPICSWDR